MKKLFNSMLIVTLAASVSFGSIAFQKTTVYAKTPAVSKISSSDKKDTIDNSETVITMMLQEYIGDNIAEIPMLQYDGTSPALKEFGGKNPEIEMINNEIKYGILQTYNEFMDEGSDVYWMEIKTYPFTSDRYLQTVMTSIVYPNYGTDGTMWSYNFDKVENRRVSLEEVMAKLKLTKSIITENVINLYSPESKSISISKVEPVGFLISDGFEGQVTQILLEVTVDNTEADSWICFYSYTPELEELKSLDGRYLFDPWSMDQMQPPLYYQNFDDETLVNPLGLTMTFDVSGLEILEHGYEYMLDGAVHFITERIDPVDPEPYSIIENITMLENYDIELHSIAIDDALSAKFSYPAWLVVYGEGSNEDSQICIDVYIQTDSGDFRFHTSTPLDYIDEYIYRIYEKVSTIELVTP